MPTFSLQNFPTLSSLNFKYFFFSTLPLFFLFIIQLHLLLLSFPSILPLYFIYLYLFFSLFISSHFIFNSLIILFSYFLLTFLTNVTLIFFSLAYITKYIYLFSFLILPLKYTKLKSQPLSSSQISFIFILPLHLATFFFPFSLTAYNTISQTNDHFHILSPLSNVTILFFFSGFIF